MTVRWEHRPDLDRPALVAAFEGWNDAGDAASGALRWLVQALDAGEFASIDPDDYVDFQATRPTVELVDGVTRTLTWPRTRMLASRSGGRDLVLVVGTEPNYHWRAYCDDVLETARSLGCTEACTLGALLADVPHSRAVSVTGTARDGDTIARLGLEPSRYEGPTGIVGVLQHACLEAGLPAASLWAPVPHYAATPPSPKASLALLTRLGGLLALDLDLDALETAATRWQARIDELVAEDEEVARYVHELEERFDDRGADGRPLAEGELPSGDALAADIEQFLREQRDE